jgi:iron complex outermembrane recepter protein
MSLCVRGFRFLGSAATLICILFAGSQAALATPKTFDIGPSDASHSLLEFGRQASIQIIFASEKVKGFTTNAVRGNYEPLDAIHLLLSGTGLSVSEKAGGVLVVEPAKEKRVSPGTAREGEVTYRDSSVAQATQPALTESSSTADGSGRPPQDKSDQITEIIVTAKTGSQAVRAISGSVTALTGAQLEASGAQSFEDYLTGVPGVVFNAGIPGLSSVTIRGVSTTVGVNNGQGTTGYFINDVPLTDPFNSAGIPDIDTFDVSDVTVLRGPQGTLFGSASLGGAINYQAAQPNLYDYEAHVQGTVEGTDHGGVGGSGKIMVNVPIVSDMLAIRAVFVHRTDAGYIDNIGTGRKDANETIVNGGRLEIAWQPSSATRVNYMLLEQSEDTADIGDQQPQFAGSLEKNTLIPEPDNFRTTVHNLRLDQDFSFGTLTATATYHEKTSSIQIDYTAPSAPSFPGIDPVRELEILNTDGTTFEVRLASRPGERFDYLVGLYHDDTHEHTNDTFSAANAAAVIESTYSGLFGAGIGQLSAPGGDIFQGYGPFRGQESALFGEATYHFNDQWKLTLGGRAFETKSTSTTTEADFFELVNTGTLQETLAGKQSESNFAPKGALTWTPSNDFMAYALVSKGFRFGGPNISPSSTTFAIPPSFATDSLINYEIGERSSWFDNRLQLDASLFYIDWSNIQLQFYSPAGISYVTNASKATNYGLEDTATWRILPGLTLQTNLTYLEATLGADYSPGAGQAIIPAGATLPGASKWQVANSLSYQWRGGPFEPVFLLSQRYISSAPGDFGGGVPPGGYELFDARATFHFNRFALSAFGDNLGNSHGVTSGQSTAGLPLAQYIVRPRTIGVTVDMKL